jgi:hypothetical protein
MQTYTFFTAAKCTCGFLWTSAADQAVICACGDTGIAAGIVSGTPQAYLLDDLKAAIASEIGVPFDDLQLVEGQ